VVIIKIKDHNFNPGNQILISTPCRISFSSNLDQQFFIKSAHPGRIRGENHKYKTITSFFFIKLAQPACIMEEKHTRKRSHFLFFIRPAHQSSITEEDHNIYQNSTT
jgi:hypothetical protein